MKIIKNNKIKKDINFKQKNKKQAARLLNSSKISKKERI